MKHDATRRYHKIVNRHLCPSCGGSAKAPDGTWCVPCKRTGIENGLLPASARRLTLLGPNPKSVQDEDPRYD